MKRTKDFTELCVFVPRAKKPMRTSRFMGEQGIVLGADEHQK